MTELKENGTARMQLRGAGEYVSMVGGMVPLLGGDALL